LVEEAGGGCSVCGYDRYLGALHFHHIDPETKSFTLAALGITRSLDAMRREIRKCVLLCANCHAEIEGGVVTATLD
jgi:5-methylcytosine-specific restriction endonuclease McrA